MKPNVKIGFCLAILAISILVPYFIRFFDGYFVITILISVFSVAFLSKKEFPKYLLLGSFLSFILALLIFKFSKNYQDLPLKFLLHAWIYGVVIWWSIGLFIGFILFKSFQIRLTKSLMISIMTSLSIMVFPLLLHQYIEPGSIIPIIFFVFSLINGYILSTNEKFIHFFHFMLPFILYCLIFLVIDSSSFLEPKILSVMMMILGSALLGNCIGIMFQSKQRKVIQQEGSILKPSSNLYLGLGLLSLIILFFSTPVGSHVKMKLDQYFLMEPKLNFIQKLKLEDDFWNKEVQIYDQAISFQLKQFKGKPILINYWGTWCGPCVTEMPSFQKLYNSQKEEVHFLFIAVNDTTEKIQKFMEKNQYDFPVYQIKDSLSIEINPTSYPTTYIFNAKGELVLKETGSSNWNSAEIHQFLDSLK